LWWFFKINFTFVADIFQGGNLSKKSRPFPALFGGLFLHLSQFMFVGGKQLCVLPPFSRISACFFGEVTTVFPLQASVFLLYNIFVRLGCAAAFQKSDQF
jgi:hypothetical protein